MTTTTTESKQSRNNRLVRRAQAGDIAARNELIEANYGLILSAVNGPTLYGADRDAYISYATEAFIRCVKSFNPDKGIHLSTYVCGSMRKEIYRAYHCERGVISTPELGRKRTTLECWEAAARAKVTQAVPMALAAPTERTADRSGQMLLWSYIDALEPSQREVVTDLMRGHKQHQIAERLGVSRGRVQQLKAQAFDTLRQLMVA